jgi:hypothetical protein
VGSVYVLLDTRVVDEILKETECNSDAISGVLEWLKTKSPPPESSKKRLIILTARKLEKETMGQLKLARTKKNLFRKHSIWQDLATVEMKFLDKSWIQSRDNARVKQRILRCCRKDLKRIGDDVKFVTTAVAVLSEAQRFDDRGYVFGVQDLTLERAISCSVNAAFGDANYEVCEYHSLWDRIADR